MYVIDRKEQKDKGDACADLCGVRDLCYHQLFLYSTVVYVVLWSKCLLDTLVDGAATLINCPVM